MADVVDLATGQSRLVYQDLTTGKAADLPAGKFGLPTVLYW